jgi:hypothetical protein
VAEAKTTRTNASVAAFVGCLTDPERRKDCAALVRVMSKASGSCLHIKRLSDVHLDVLGRLIADSAKRAKARDLAE